MKCVINPGHGLMHIRVAESPGRVVLTWVDGYIHKVQIVQIQKMAAHHVQSTM